MLTFFDYCDGRARVVPSLAQASIVRAVSPNVEERALLVSEAGIPEDFVLAPFDRDERPRIEVEDTATLILIRIPLHDVTSETPYVTVAFALVVTPRHIVTICSEDSQVWDALVGAPHRLPSPEDRVAFLSFLFLRVARQYLTFLARIREQADEAEKVIHESMQNEMLIRMLQLEKCLIFFSTSLRANEPIWDRFRRVHGRELNEAEQDLIEDVKIEFTQARELAEIYSNVLTGMMAAFASIISNNLNVVMKFLTCITIILMIPTLVASIYGMNVGLPMQHSSHAFLVTMVVSVALSIGGVALFLKKRWF